MVKDAWGPASDYAQLTKKTDRRGHRGAEIAEADAHDSASRSWIESRVNHKRLRIMLAFVIDPPLNPCRRPQAAAHAQQPPPALCLPAIPAIGRRRAFSAPRSRGLGGSRQVSAGCHLSPGLLAFVRSRGPAYVSRV